LSDNEEEMEQDDDPSYVPDPKDIDADDDDTGFDDFDDCLYEESPQNASPHQQNVFLVAESSLLNLFRFCPVCRSECERMVESRIGTKITVSQKCYSCTFTTSWDSQPSVGGIPDGNIMLSSSILFGGGSPTKVLKILKHMNVPTIWYSTFMNHQKKYLHTAVQKTYQQQQSSLLNNIKAEGRELIEGGNGRCDSPEHSAKYGTYSLMDAEQNKILHSQLIQNNEVKNSGAMEKEGLARSLTFLTGEGLSINTLITDRQVQIRKYMRERWRGVQHRLDGWHVGKGTQRYENLTELLTKGSLLKDIKQISGQHATSSLEAFRSVYNHFAAKMVAFSYHGVTSRYEDLNIS